MHSINSYSQFSCTALHTYTAGMVACFHFLLFQLVPAAQAERAEVEVSRFKQREGNNVGSWSWEGVCVCVCLCVKCQKEGFRPPSSS